MLDEEKDLFIKKKLQQDKIISSKANDIFKNFEIQNLASDNKKNKSENKTIEFHTKNEKTKEHNLYRKIKNFTAVAASFVVAVSVGAGVALYGASNKKTEDNNSQVTSVNINGGSTASDYTVAEVKNEEVKVEENKEKKVHENDLIKAVLTTDGNVAIQLKKEFLNLYKLRLDSSKMYKVSQINGEVEDVFVCSMESKEFPYVLLLMKDKTVDVVQILNGETTPYDTSDYEFNFYDQGKIEGLKNISGFEEETEPRADSDELYYYVSAIKTDGTKKIIDSLEHINMTDVSNNVISYSSQDGNKTYKIMANEGDYIQAYGWTGASNNVYYINDNCLYHMSIVDGKKTKLITGVESIKTDEDGFIIAKLKFSNCIHKYDQYLKIEGYNVTDSKVIDKRENEELTLCLKEDGSITLELKQGAKEKLGAKDTFKENYIYNFYAKEYSVQVYNEYSNYDVRKQGVNNYANASAIYLGEIGTKDKICVAYATKDNKTIEIDIESYLKNSVSSTFEGEPGNHGFVLGQTDHQNKILEMNEKVLSISLPDGTSKECTAIEAIHVDGTKEILPITTILNHEGIFEYTIAIE
ncbi:MAG: hypothetical protein IJH12_02310 [Clostridia bacterium]|nr:hypothetical protein [Clostridia bacterium]